ncbi:MAG: hypothetical protein NTY12_01615 [Candidatus Falkowbacteria bacterium]|nr:hypothetical protein [Candidatus Falkowbacteria bacterium]
MAIALTVVSGFLLRVSWQKKCLENQKNLTKKISDLRCNEINLIKKLIFWEDVSDVFSAGAHIIGSLKKLNTDLPPEESHLFKVLARSYFLGVFNQIDNLLGQGLFFVKFFAAANSGSGIVCDNIFLSKSTLLEILQKLSPEDKAGILLQLIINCPSSFAENKDYKTFLMYIGEDRDNNAIIHSLEGLYKTHSLHEGVNELEVVYAKLLLLSLKQSMQAK